MKSTCYNYTIIVNVPAKRSRRSRGIGKNENTPLKSWNECGVGILCVSEHGILISDGNLKASSQKRQECSKLDAVFIEHPVSECICTTQTIAAKQTQTMRRTDKTNIFFSVVFSSE